jgi:hypothetical protein
MTIRFDDLHTTKNGYSAGINIYPRLNMENANIAVTKAIKYKAKATAQKLLENSIQDDLMNQKSRQPNTR